MKHLFNVIVKEIVRSICVLCLLKKQMATLVDVDGICFIRIFFFLSEIIIAIVRIQLNAAAARDNPTIAKIIIVIHRHMHFQIGSSNN